MKRIQGLLCAVMCATAIQAQNGAAPALESADVSRSEQVMHKQTPSRGIFSGLDTRKDKSMLVDTVRECLPDLDQSVADDFSKLVMGENLSPKTKEAVIKLYEKVVKLTEQKEALLAITYVDVHNNVKPAFDESHQAVQALNHDISLAENEMYALLYNSGWSTSKMFLSAGIGAFAAVVAYRVASQAHDSKKSDAYSDRAVNAIYSRMPHVSRHFNYSEAGKTAKHHPKIAAALTFVFTTLVAEHAISVLHGEQSQGVRTIATGVQKAGQGIGKALNAFFADGGYADRFEQWLEKKFRGVGNFLKDHQGDKIEIGLGLIGLAAAGYWLYKHKNPTADSVS